MQYNRKNFSNDMNKNITHEDGNIIHGVQHEYNMVIYQE